MTSRAGSLITDRERPWALLTSVGLATGRAFLVTKRKTEHLKCQDAAKALCNAGLPLEQPLQYATWQHEANGCDIRQRRRQPTRNSAAAAPTTHPWRVEVAWPKEP